MQNRKEVREQKKQLRREKLVAVFLTILFSALLTLVISHAIKEGALPVWVGILVSMIYSALLALTLYDSLT